jgi:hypothetical protein
MARIGPVREAPCGLWQERTIMADLPEAPAVSVALRGRQMEIEAIPNSDSPELGLPLTQRGKTK